jgi:hypothetical protein
LEALSILIARLPIILLLTIAPQISRLAMEPRQIVDSLYAEYPWQTLPSGGHGNRATLMEESCF